MVFIVNGAARNGKTTFENLVNKIGREKYGLETAIFSTIDCIKDIALDCGWNGEKDEKSRAMLSDMKILFTKYLDYPFKETCKQIDMSILDGVDFIFVDSREREDIKRYVDKYEAITIYIENINNKESFYNSADIGARIDHYPYDYCIENNGTLEDLENRVIEFIEKYKGE